MLVDQEILGEINCGSIVIEPFQKENLQSGSYYFHLGRIILIPKEGQIIQFDGDNDPIYDRFDMKNNPFILEPGKFVLGQTKEILTIKNNIGMFIDGRTTLARLGLQIHQTASFIQPGHTESIITLEIFNAGNFQIELKEGIDIAKGIFFKSDKSATTGYKDNGIYSSQKETTPPDIFPYKK